jgi:microcystin-dependent protein
MSTKYQRPNSAFAGNSALANRTKYQDDASAVPKIAISSTKVDGDFNYVVDALNEIDQASGVRASINDRLNVSFNADGTLKSSVTATLDEWVNHEIANFARVDDYTVQGDGDHTGLYTRGRRVRMTVNGTLVYADVASAVFNGTITTISLVGVVNAQGQTAVISQTPTVISYSPFTTGAVGNTPTDFSALKVRDIAPILRIKQDGGGEFGLRPSATALDFVENTGTEEIPSWQLMGQVNSGGFVLGNGTVTLTKLASGTANKLLGFDGVGAPAEVDLPQPFVAGLIMPFAGASTPAGWLLCDGAAISRTTYANLFTAIGTVYGVGDGSTTFNLPDLRGRSIFGLDNMGGTSASRVTSGVSGLAGSTLGAAGGSEAIQQHTHGVTDSGHSHVQGLMSPNSGTRYGSTNTGVNAGWFDSGSATTGADGANTSTETTGLTIDNTGAGNSQNMPPAMMMNWVIKV